MKDVENIVVSTFLFAKYDYERKMLMEERECTKFIRKQRRKRIKVKVKSFAHRLI